MWVKQLGRNRKTVFNLTWSIAIALVAILFFIYKGATREAAKEATRETVKIPVQENKLTVSRPPSLAASPVDNDSNLATTSPATSNSPQTSEDNNGANERIFKPVLDIPPELPEDLKRQLEAPPAELPPDLKRQLEAPPPPLPEDIKRALATPPRIVTEDEVNTPPTKP